MTVILAALVGVLYAAGAFLLLGRRTVGLVIGLVLFGHATNLVVFTSAGLSRGPAPVVPEGANELPAHAADPLPQALILTAIVITFGLIAFTATLVKRIGEVAQTDDLDELRTTDT